VNQFESEVMEGLFKQRGYETVAFDQIADVYVINTCSVTHLGEKKSRQLIRRAIRLNPEAIVAATGCYSQVAPEQVQAIEGVGVIIGTKDRNRIVDYVEEAAADRKQVNAVGDVMTAGKFEDIPLFEAPERTRGFLKIQEGCSNFCTYCIIPYARGPLRSRPLDSVAQEARKLVDAGFREIVLTGIHLGAYGRDLDPAATLTDAVERVLQIPELTRLRLGSLETIEVPAEIIEAMKRDRRLCPHLHLPLQGGDDYILKAMNRHYTVSEYQCLLEGIREQVPNIAVSTDLIVGFPGETDEMFDNALATIKRMGFSRMHIFPYSPRKGTPAASFAGQVTEEEKKRRVQVVQQLAEQMAAEFHRKFLGKTVDVLFETENGGIADGLTGNYIRVYTKTGSGILGKVCKVTLQKDYHDGLWGTLVD
jgi:threonylcarbamoyladenosine tRNA methylthiotransferase MtaB